MQSTQPMPPTRRRPSTAVAVGLAIAGALTIPLVAAQHASAAPVQCSAVLLASDETTPVTAADAAAVGTADVTIDAATGQICVAIATSGLSGAITAAHIHSGGAGVAGPVVVPLPTGTGTASGCAESTPTQAASIVAAPNMFYVNVHTAANAGGAARGQLTASVFAATSPEQPKRPALVTATGPALRSWLSTRPPIARVSSSRSPTSRFLLPWPTYTAASSASPAR